MGKLGGVNRSVAYKILILEDEKQILDMMEMHFSANLFKVDGADNADQAKKMLNNATYAVVILDLCLTSIDRTEGLDMIKYIQKKSPDTGIVVYTANSDPKVEKLAKQLGVDSFILKPAPLSNLNKIVHSLIENREKRGFPVKK